MKIDSLNPGDPFAKYKKVEWERPLTITICLDRTKNVKQAVELFNMCKNRNNKASKIILISNGEIQEEISPSEFLQKYPDKNLLDQLLNSFDEVRVYKPIDLKRRVYPDTVQGAIRNARIVLPGVCQIDPSVSLNPNISPKKDYEASSIRGEEVLSWLNANKNRSVEFYNGEKCVGVLEFDSDDEVFRDIQLQNPDKVRFIGAKGETDPFAIIKVQKE